MPPRKANPSALKRTTQLPPLLRKELEDLGKLKPLKINKKNLGRKERRKEERNDGKKNRADHFANKKRKADEEAGLNMGQDEEEEEEKEKEVEEPRKKKSKPTPVPTPSLPIAKVIPYQTPLEKLLAKQTGSNSAVDTRRANKSKLESTEDLEIAWLEAKLGVRGGPPPSANKAKGSDKESKGKWKEEYLEDGLDDLFEGIDELESAAFGKSTKNYKDLLNSDDDEELNDNSEEDDSENSEDDEDESEESEFYGISDDELVRPDDDDDHFEMGELGSDDEEDEGEEGGMTATFDQNDFAISKGKGKGKGLESSEEEREENDTEEEDSEDDSEDDEDLDSEEEAAQMNYDDPWAGMGSGESGDEDGGMTMTFGGDSFASAPIVEKKKEKKEKKGVSFELDEPVASTSTSTAAPTKYVPPHMRQSASNLTTSIAAVAVVDSKSTTSAISTISPPSDPRLRRQILGHLNKLSSSNMSSLLPLILAFYSTHPRALVSTELTSLLMEIIATSSSLGDNFIITYAALVGAIGRNVGVEFMAGLVSRSVGLFDEAREKSRSASLSGKSNEGGFEGKPGNKEAENLVAFLSELYNFGVLSCVLIYDLVRMFIESGLGELEVELLVKVIKRAGQQLRQDDPSALKEIIGLVKVKMARADATTMNLRTRFMLDALTNLKNNKIKPDANGAVDNYSNLKKFLSGLKKGSGSIPEPLRLTLADIRSSSSKGKWWIVGAAWGGNPLVDDAAKFTLSGSGIGGKAVESDEVLSKLARKQGMNTDIRKGVFHVLMSSEDYVDACERLLQLGLTDVQQREIARVLLQCSGNEKSYNPYYTLVAHRMGTKSHSFQITLQYCLWDFFRELGEKSVGGEELVKTITDDGSEVKKVSSRRIINLAKLYAWCVAKDVLSLAILKPVPFSRPKPQTIIFLQQFFSSLIISTQCSSPALILNALITRKDRESLEMVFVKAASFPNLVRGLVHFLDEYMEGKEEKGEKEEAMVKWGKRIAKETISASDAIFVR